MSLHVIKLVSCFLRPAQVLRSYGIPKLQSKDRGIVTLFDMGDSGSSDITDISAQHGIKIPAKFEKKLIDLIAITCPHIREDIFEDLTTILLIFKDVPQKDHTISERVERHFNNIAILPETDQQTA